MAYIGNPPPLRYYDMTRRPLAGLLALLVATLPGCGNDCPNCPGRLAEVRVSPDTASVLLGGRAVRLAVLGLDGKQHLLTISKPAWTSLDQATATVSDSGDVTGVAVGTARIVAQLEGKADTGFVAVVTTSTFSRQVYPVLRTTCAIAFCHISPPPAPNMGSLSAAYSALTAPAGGYFTPGDTTVPGKLLRRIRGDTAPMPPGGALVKLQPGNYDLITQWIQQGALNN